MLSDAGALGGKAMGVQRPRVTFGVVSLPLILLSLVVILAGCGSRQ